MKFEKKHWIMLIAGVVILYLVYWFFFRNSKKSESSYDPYLPIFGGDMLENNNYTAAMLDPKGIESGYSAMQLDPRGIESGYKQGKPIMVNCQCDPFCAGVKPIMECRRCCSQKGCQGRNCTGTGTGNMSAMRTSGTPQSTDVTVYACYEGRRYIVRTDGTIYSVGQKCNGKESMTIL